MGGSGVGVCWRGRRKMWWRAVFLLTNIVLQYDEEDKWYWNLHSSHNYTVNSAYHLLSAEDINPPFISVDLTWHKAVPLKLCLFA